MRTRLWFALSVAALSVAASGCRQGWPQQRVYFVVHVAADDCLPDYSNAPVVAVRQDDGQDGDSIVDVAMTEFTGRCGPTGHGHKTQVWRTPVRHQRTAPATLHIGMSAAADNTYLLPPNARMRIDHTHLWLGVVVVAGGERRFLVPAATGSARALEGRQGCETYRRATGDANESVPISAGCGETWERSDLLDFAPVRTSVG